MPLPDQLSMRHADLADLPQIAELRESLGWGAQDWALRAVLEPPDSRCLVVVDDRDRVVGVGSGIAYGALGFVGNMVVDDNHRRRGVGSAILTSVIDFLAGRGADRLETMARVPRRVTVAADGIELVDGEPAVLDELVAYDAPRFGGNRRALLGPMLEDAERPLIVARRDRQVVGYGWVRPDGERVGPLLADTPEIATALVGEAFERLPTTEALSLNLPPGNRDGAVRLAELGADLEQWDGRMGRGPQVPRREDTLYGMVVGALG